MGMNFIFIEYESDEVIGRNVYDLTIILQAQTVKIFERCK